MVPTRAIAKLASAVAVGGGCGGWGACGAWRGGWRRASQISSKAIGDWAVEFWLAEEWFPRLGRGSDAVGNSLGPLDNAQIPIPALAATAARGCTDQNVSQGFQFHRIFIIRRFGFFSVKYEFVVCCVPLMSGALTNIRRDRHCGDRTSTKSEKDCENFPNKALT